MIQIKSSLFPLIRSWVAYAALPAAGIITAPILAHALGPTGRGQLAGILQPLTLASAVAAIGVPSAVTFFIGQSEEVSRVIKFAVKISLLTTLIVGIALIFYSWPVANRLGSDRFWIIVIWTAFLPSALISIRRAHIQGLRRYRTLDLERTLAAASRVAIIVLLWAMGVTSVTTFAVAYMVSGLCASIVLRLPASLGASIQTKAHTKTTGSKIDSEFTHRTFLQYSMFSAFGTIAAAMSARLDQAIMPSIVSAEQLGYYSVAVSIAELSTIITSVITRNIMAEVSNRADSRLVLASLFMGTFAELGLILMLIVGMPYVLPIVFGSRFGPSIVLIYILLLGALLNFFASVASAYLAGFGRPGLSSAGQAAAALFTVALFWYYWNQMNSECAAWISAASQIVAAAVSISLVYWVHQKQKRGHPISAPAKTGK